MKLRPYQMTHIKRLVRELKENSIAALFSAVGSGKTTEAKIVISEVRTILGIKRVIISSPFLTIAKGFETSGKDEVYTGPVGSVNTSSYVVPGNSIRLVDSETIKEMKRLLKSPGYTTKSFSHACLARLGEKLDDPSISLENTLLVIDEAHHCFHDDEEGGTLLGRVVNKAIEKGAKVLYLTATPYRTEGSQTIPIVDINECNPVVRTIGEQIRDGYSPSVDVEYVHIKGDHNFLENKYKHDPTIVDSPNVIFSKPKQARIYAQYIYDQWVKDGCPKGIIVIPGGESVKVAEQVKTYFTEKGLPEEVSKVRGRTVPAILDAVGDKTSDREKILKDIAEDKANDGHTFDLVIGCRRFDEGTDVPSASHVYMMGVPGNVRLFHQRVGRILRDKRAVTGYYEWFGESWLEKAKATFFVPLFTKLNELDYQVARQLLHCVFAGENYQAYCDSASMSIELQKAADLLRESAADHEDEIEEVIRSLDAFKMSDEMSHAQRVADLTLFVHKNPGITVKQFCEKALDGVTDSVEKLAIQTAIVENLSCVSEQDIRKMSGDVIDKVIHNVGAPKNDPGMTLRPCDNVFEKEMGLAFKALIRRFEKEEVSLKSEGYVDRALVSLTEENLAHWVERCEFLYDNEERSNKICREVCEWKRAHNGQNPDSHSMHKEELLLANWLFHRKQYKQNKKCGTFYESDQEIANSYGYADLFEVRDLEALSNKFCHEVCKWKKTHGDRNPNKHSDNRKEKSLATWISNSKKSFRGDGRGQFYESNQQIAESYGYPNLFEVRDLETESNETCKKLCEWVDKNGKIPSQTTILGKWLAHRKGAFQSRGHSTFYNSDQEIAESYGYPDLFEIRNLEVKSNETCKELCEWIKNKGGLPRQDTLLGQWLSGKRKIKSGKKRWGSFYDSDQKIAESYGYTDLFEIRNLEVESNKTCKKVCMWVKEKGSIPSQHSSENEERFLATWISNRRRALKGSGGGAFYESDMQIAVSMGCSDIFSQVNHEKNSNAVCLETCLWISAKGRKPNKQSKDREGYLGRWLSNRRRALKGSGNGSFYESDQKIAESYGYPDLFERVRK